MRITGNLKVQKNSVASNLLVEIEKNDKTSWLDINQLPLDHQMQIVRTNAEFIEYIVSPSIFLKALVEELKEQEDRACN